jgi:hypothetical protein
LACQRGDGELLGDRVEVPFVHREGEVDRRKQSRRRGADRLPRPDRDAAVAAREPREFARRGIAAEGEDTEAKSAMLA